MILPSAYVFEIRKFNYKNKLNFSAKKYLQHKIPFYNFYERERTLLALTQLDCFTYYLFD